MRTANFWGPALFLFFFFFFRLMWRLLWTRESGRPSKSKRPPRLQQPSLAAVVQTHVAASRKLRSDLVLAPQKKGAFWVAASGHVCFFFAE